MYQRKDPFYTRAKAEGYRSRAAFKLLQLARRIPLFRRGDRVLELGAWPGGWLQVAAQGVGPTGRVIGVDLQPIDRLPATNVTTLVGDIADLDVQRRVAEACAGSVDIVLSDLAPKLSGVKSSDAARADALAAAALKVTEQFLRPGGTLVIKLFMSDDLPRYLDSLRGFFETVQVTRPPATRRESAEVYAVARGFRAAHNRR